MEQNQTPTTPYSAPSSSDEKTLALLAHVLTIFVGFLAPLVIFLVKKDESKFVGDAAKESLNFQLTLFIAYIIAGVLCIVLIGFLLFPLIWIGNLVFVIIATIKTSEGQMYRYPFCIRFIS